MAKTSMGAGSPLFNRQAGTRCKDITPPVDQESFLRGLLDNSDSAIFVCDADGCLLSVNHAYETMMGMAESRLVGSTAHQLFEKDDADRMLAGLRSVIRKGRSMSYEAEFLVGGMRRSFINALFPLQDAKGNATSACGIVTEITEHKRYEDELRIAHRALTVLGEVSSAVVFATDEIELGTNVCRIIVERGGYRLAWVGLVEEGGTLTTLAEHGVDRKCGSCLQVALQSWYGDLPLKSFFGEGKMATARFIDTDSRFDGMRAVAFEMGFRAVLAVSLGLGDYPEGLLCICAPESDAFEPAEVEMLGKLGATLSHGFHSIRMERTREETRRALLESEARYRAVVEDQTEVISRFLADGTFTFVNDVYCRVFGKPLEELLGNTWQPVCHEADLERVQQELQALDAHNPVVLIENRVVDSEGRQRWMQFVNRGFFDEQGSLLEIQSVGRDITRQKELQQEAMRAAKLASLGELAAGVAHEINNPIQGIINCAQLLVDDTEDAMGEGKFAWIILQEGRRIAEIVRSLLTMARQKDETASLLHPQEALLLALDLMRTQMVKAGVDISFESQESLPLIKGNKGQLQQVFLNLLANAFHALEKRYPGHEPGKKLELFLGKEIRDSVTMLVWSIRDHGEGIAEGDQSKLFAPFYTTKAPGEGTGLGLSISRAIIAQHKGRIELTNAPGQGAVAVVTIPAADGLEG